MGEKHSLPILKLFFPKVCYSIEIGRSPGLRLVINLLISLKDNGNVENNKLYSLQLRVQLKTLKLEFRFQNLEIFKIIT